MKKIFIILFIIITNLLLYANNDFFNIPLNNSWMLATEQSVINNNNFSVVSNPALLSNIKKTFLLEYNKIFYFAQTNYDSIGLSFGKRNKVGIVFNKFSSGEIRLRNIDGLLKDETMNYSLIAITTGLSISFDLYTKNHILNIGVAESFLFDNLTPDTSKFISSLGTSYDFYSNKLKTLRFGFVIKGINYLEFSTYHFGFLIKTGLLSIISGYENKTLDNKNGKIKTSLLFEIPFPANIIVSLGIGYNFAQNYSSDILTTGFGIESSNILFTYSYSFHESLGSINSIQVGIKL